jgi:hypothetical protein
MLAPLDMHANTAAVCESVGGLHFLPSQRRMCALCRPSPFVGLVTCCMLKPPCDPVSCLYPMQLIHAPEFRSFTFSCTQVFDLAAACRTHHAQYTHRYLSKVAGSTIHVCTAAPSLAFTQAIPACSYLLKRVSY